MFRNLKSILSAACVVFPLVFSQAQNPKKIQGLQNSTGSEEVKSLHRQLIANADDDESKVRVFYSWIGENIRYDVATYVSGSNDAESQSPKSVLINRKAVCHGYSDLFRSLCELSGIPCYMVSGYTRANNSFSGEGHTWNAVFVNGSWRHVDITWGAGYMEEGKWVKEFSKRYFLSLTDSFLTEHLPFDPMWQLREQLIPLSNFKTGTPYSQKSPIFAYSDTIETWRKLDEIDRELQSAYRMKRFAPSDAMANYNLSFALIDAGNAAMDKHIFWMSKLPKNSSVSESEFPVIKSYLDSASYYGRQADLWYRQAKPTDQALATNLRENSKSLEYNMDVIRKIRNYISTKR